MERNTCYEAGNKVCIYVLCNCSVASDGNLVSEH